MPYHNAPLLTQDDHLQYLFRKPTTVRITEGEHERMICIRRELQMLKDALGDAPLENCLLSGTALKTLFALLDGDSPAQPLPDEAAMINEAFDRR